jgi:hypothetical protein
MLGIHQVTVLLSFYVLYTTYWTVALNHCCGDSEDVTQNKMAIRSHTWSFSNMIGQKENWNPQGKLWKLKNTTSTTDYCLKLSLKISATAKMILSPRDRRLGIRKCTVLLMPDIYTRTKIYLKLRWPHCGEPIGQRGFNRLHINTETYAVLTWWEILIAGSSGWRRR